MKLYQIEYLMAVCRYGSISKAADELLVSRPAVSRAIKDLENEFGVSFFLRTTTGVLMTEAGQLVYEKCQKIEQMFSELQTELKAMKTDADGKNDRQLHIGISFTARCCFLPFITAFRQSHPDILLMLTDLEDSFVDSGVLNPDFDLEIALSEDKPYEGVEYLEIEESSLTFCCSKKHPLAGRSSVSILEIKDEPLCGLNHIEQKDNQVQLLFARHGLTPNLAFMTQQVSFLRQMIRENLCCSIKPQQSTENDPDIVTIPIDEAKKLHLRILWSDSAYHNSAFRDFIDYAREILPRS